MRGGSVFGIDLTVDRGKTQLRELCVAAITCNQRNPISTAPHRAPAPSSEPPGLPLGAELFYFAFLLLPAPRGGQEAPARLRRAVRALCARPRARPCVAHIMVA